MAQKNIQDEDPLVAGLKGPLTGAVLLRGWVSRSGPDGWRLFPDVSLGTYIEFKDSDVVHNYRMDADRGTLVWLKADAIVEEIRSGTAEDLTGGAPAGPAPTATSGPAPGQQAAQGAPRFAAGGWGGGSGGWGGGIPAPDPCKGVPSVSGRSCCNWLC